MIASISFSFRLFFGGAVDCVIFAINKNPSSYGIKLGITRNLLILAPGLSDILMVTTIHRLMEKG